MIGNPGCSIYIGGVRPALSIDYEAVTPGQAWTPPAQWAFTRASNQFTVQTSASTLTSGLTGNNTAYVGNRGGLTGAAWSNGLSFEESRYQCITATPRSVSAQPGAGTSTLTVVGVGPDGGSGANYPVRSVSTSSQFAQYISTGATAVTSPTLSIWQKRGGSETVDEMVITTASGAIFRINDLSTSWSRFVSCLPQVSAAVSAGQVSEGRNTTSSGGLAAGARDVITDFMQLESGRFATEAITTATTTRAAPRLTAPASQLVGLDGRIHWTVDLTLSGSPGMYSSPIQIGPYFSASKQGFSINTNGRLIVSLGETQNLMLYSEDFSQWTNSQSSDTTGSDTAPDSTQNATRLIESNASSQHIIYRVGSGVSGIGKSVVVSLYVKAGGGTARNVGLYVNGIGAYAVFDPSTGALVTNSDSTVIMSTGSESVGSGWYRIYARVRQTVASETIQINLLSGTTLSYLGDGSSYVLIFGCQVNTTPDMLPYAVTTSAAVDNLWSPTTDLSPYLVQGGRAKISISAGGGSSNSKAKIKLSDNSVLDLGSSSTPQAAISTAGTIDVIGNNGSNVPSGLIHSIKADVSDPVWFTGGTPTWIPNALSPYLWTRSDLGCSLGVQGVSQWNDQSGNGRNFTQGTTGNQPRYWQFRRNGLPAIVWPGITNALYLTASGLSIMSGDFTTIIVCDETSAEYSLLQARGAGLPSTLVTGGTNTQINTHSAYNSTNAYMYVGGTSVSVGTTAQDDFNFYMISDVGSTKSGQCNGSTTSAVSSAHSTETSLRIGWTSSSAVGGVYEVIHLERGLTSGEKTSLSTYLTNRYGKAFAVAI